MKPLKPVMAALLAASSATSALPGTSYANPVMSPPATGQPAPAVASSNSTGAATCPPADTETNPVNILTCLITQNPAALTDVGARFSRFVESKDGPQYLAPALKADTTLLPATLKLAADWPAKNKDNPGKIAVLYFVMGPDAAGLPVWVQSSVLSKTLKPDMIWSKRLASALATRHWTDTKQIPQSGAADAVVAFLNDAADQAQKILDDPRVPDEIKKSIGDNDTTGPTPPESPVSNRPNPLDATGSGFTRDDLYVKGAEVANVYSPDDKGYRTISMKVYTSLDDSGNPINRIGIVDITDGDITTPTVPQFIDSSKPGDTDLKLRPDGRSYTVTVGSDGSVTLKRTDTKDGAGGSIATSLSGLTKDRNDQIMNSGTVSVGGRPYYVLGQGGAKGSFLFFAKDQLDANPTGNAHPELMGDVSQVIGDGSTAPIKGKPDLGTLTNGDAYHLEFDMNTRMWKVVPGAGDKKDPKTPKGPKPPKTPTDGSTDPGTDPTAPTGPTGPTDPTTGSAATLDQAIAIAKQDKSDKTQVWAEDAGNSGFDADTLSKIRIMSNVQQKDGMKHFNVLFDPSLGVNDNHFEFLPISQNVRLLGIRGVKKYVVMEYATNTQYYDLQNFANYVQHVYDSSLSYQQAGSFSTQNGQMQNVTDVDIMADVLTHPMKIKADDPMIATLRARVKKNVKDGAGYTINGDAKTIYLGSGEMGMTIWPDEIKAGDNGTNANMTGLRGPGTAVAVTGGGPAEFKSEMDMGSGRTAALVKQADDKHSAIYSATEDENVNGTITPAKVWYVMIDYKKNGLDSRSKALPVFGGKNRFKLPAGVQFQGFPGVDLPDTTQLMMLYGSTQEKGAIAAYRYVLPDAQGGQNAKDKAGNCAGPVLWWGGVTKEKAQSACAGDSKVP